MQQHIYSNNLSPPFILVARFNMKDRLERFVLLPFAAGCISESSIPVVMQHAKRSKHEKHEEETKDEEEGCLDDEKSLSSQNWKTALPIFQKLFKNFSQLFVYKDEQEAEMGMEIGLPTDVKHVSHIGLDGCTSSIFSKGCWAEQELIDLHSFPLSELEFAIKAQAETPKITSLLETKCRYNPNESVTTGTH
ncbi:CRIB domain-containing protein RIC4-like [Salvia miltiorrhiza]|uniref:CRIB domain-containing protein RIC4-like n=1 Tax=Salvia miltiorrhiza TaxID=226208 RepID=UPI0025AC6AD8|nr:CRIB domain-containing protein RIC4-like [Salvia miltiorrhiza]